MKSFLLGFFGALTVLIGAMIIIPQYSDYRARVETGNWLALLTPTKQSIEKKLLQDHSLQGLENTLTKPELISNLSMWKIMANGTIVMKGGYEGQVLILFPEIKEKNIVWHCIGGSEKTMPSKCEW